jgi:PadR family transcriptional regulator PadR
LLLQIRDAGVILLLSINIGGRVAPPESEVPYGTLDLMVLKTLASMGPLHGFGIARRIEQIADGAFALNQGTIYPALLRLEQKGWIASEWGTSENNRRARFYSITRSGKKQLTAETENWDRTVAMVKRLLESEP